MSMTPDRVAYRFAVLHPAAEMTPNSTKRGLAQNQANLEATSNIMDGDEIDAKYRHASFNLAIQIVRNVTRTREQFSGHE
ncbi:hypothetical protein ABQF03_23750 [Mycolicibacterium phlei]